MPALFRKKKINNNNNNNNNYNYNNYSNKNVFTQRDYEITQMQMPENNSIEYEKARAYNEQLEFERRAEAKQTESNNYQAGKILINSVNQVMDTFKYDRQYDASISELDRATDASRSKIKTLHLNNTNAMLNKSIASGINVEGNQIRQQKQYLDNIRSEAEQKIDIIHDETSRELKRERDDKKSEGLWGAVVNFMIGVLGIAASSSANKYINGVGSGGGDAGVQPPPFDGPVMQPQEQEYAKIPHYMLLPDKDPNSGYVQDFNSGGGGGWQYQEQGGSNPTFNEQLNNQANYDRNFNQDPDYGRINTGG